MAAAGRVITGFSKPYVALYNATGSTVSYTSCQQLARGVDVAINANGSVDNIFYADNQAAESAGVAFVDGTFTLTVDGLLDAARNLIMGVTAPSASNKWTEYNDDQKLPYCGLAFVMRCVSDGVTSYVPVAFSKVMFNPTNENASTQESSVNYQTESLSGVIFRADDAKHTWKKVGKPCTSEAEAVTAITALFV